MSIQFDFSGKGVFVTDSATGLGRRIAEAFLELGAKVAIHDARPAEVERAVRELGGGPRLVAAPGDLATTANVEGIVQKAIGSLGRLDVLVCCATKAGLCGVDTISDDDFGRVMGANTKQAFFTTQSCVPALRATRGAVVHVASTIGLVGGPTGAVGYATACGATVQMTRMMALELAAEGIRVNVVCPAWAEADDPTVTAVFAEYIKTRSPLGRIATPDECAAAVLYLAAPFSAYTTGTALVADGGISSGHYVP
jgi:meso-butanediol dehydrogenase / (S,S)-butanediol dehydrogenase / diacetyl reductase